MKKIIALGFFDGVHLGHQALLDACISTAQKCGCVSAAITFDAHPQALFTNTPPPQVNTAADREKLLRQFGIQWICRLPVNKDVMSTNWQDFLSMLMEQGAAGFVCGSDFRFGRAGEGTAEKLQQFCQERALSCTVVEEQKMDGIRISSTHIRSLLERGEMTEAVRFLGHPHIFTGEVVSGRRIGRTLGIPTANLSLPEGIVVPKLGVYACRACIGEKKYPAVTNIGNRPTVGGHHITVEPWILDFAGDLYGKQITLEFYAFLRPEQQFASLDELKNQIHRDAEAAREIVSTM